MKVKKKLIRLAAIALALVMVLGVAGCGGSGGGGGAQQPSGGSQQPASPPPGPGSLAQQPAPEIVDPGPADPALVQTRTTPITLTFAHSFPATHHHHLGIVMPFVEAFMEATEGMVEIIVHPGGSLTTATTALDDVITGSIDMTWSVPGWNPGRFPMSELFELPNLYFSSVESANVLWDMMENNEDFQKEFGEAKFFNIYTCVPGTIWSVPRAVRVPSDLVGLSIRSPGSVIERSLQAAGAATANIPMGEAYDNLDRGVVTGMAADCTAIPTYSLWDVLNYGIDGMSLYVSMQFNAMSWDAWNRLNEFEQAAFDRLSGRTLGLASAIYYDELGEEAMRQIYDSGLVELAVLTPEENAEWDAVFEPLTQAYIDDLNSRGLNGQGYFDQMIAYRDARR